MKNLPRQDVLVELNHQAYEVRKCIVSIQQVVSLYINSYYYYVFILSAISPYTTGLKALFNQFDCTGTAPTHK